MSNIQKSMCKQVFSVLLLNHLSGGSVLPMSFVPIWMKQLVYIEKVLVYAQLAALSETEVPKGIL
jgi:hypothetical protein